MDVNFNINDIVYVKLTQLGITHWVNKFNSIYDGIKIEPEYLLTEEYILEKKLDNGYWSFQLWELMEIFGDILSNGNKIPFETNIVIPIELSRQNKIEKLFHENEEWITIVENDINTFPDEGHTVLVTDGIYYDVVYYIMSGEYKWIKVDVEKDDINDFTAFKIIKWKYIK